MSAPELSRPQPAPDITAQNRGPAILAVSCCSTFLSSLFVAGRLFARRRKLGRWYADDFVILLSLGLVYLFVGVLVAAIAVGFGRHAADLRLPHFELAVFLSMLGLGFGLAAFTLGKVAVVILLIAVLRPPIWHARLLWGLVLVNAIFLVLTTIVYFLQCKPPEALWKVVLDKQCWNPRIVNTLAISGCAFSGLTDFYLAIYPAAVVWSLRIYWVKKLALSAALGFGVCAGTVAILKCTTVPELLKQADYTYNTFEVVIWTIIEANSVIIAACIPLLMPLLELWFGATFLSGRQRPLPSLSISYDISRMDTTPGEDNQRPVYYIHSGGRVVSSASSQPPGT